MTGLSSRCPGVLGLLGVGWGFGGSPGCHCNPPASLLGGVFAPPPICVKPGRAGRWAPRALKTGRCPVTGAVAARAAPVVPAGSGPRGHFKDQNVLLPGASPGGLPSPLFSPHGAMARGRREMSGRRWESEWPGGLKEQRRGEEQGETNAGVGAEPRQAHKTSRLALANVPVTAESGEVAGALTPVRGRSEAFAGSPCGPRASLGGWAVGSACSQRPG